MLQCFLRKLQYFVNWIRNKFLWLFVPNRISILVTIITVTEVFIFFSSNVDFLIYSISFRNMITKFQMMKLKNNGTELDTLMFKKILLVTVIFLFSRYCNKIVKS